MKICNICKEKINNDKEINLNSTICLGTVETTYDLCENCSIKVNKFIVRAKKC